MRCSLRLRAGSAGPGSRDSRICRAALQSRLAISRPTARGVAQRKLVVCPQVRELSKPAQRLLEHCGMPRADRESGFGGALRRQSIAVNPPAADAGCDEASPSTTRPIDSESSQALRLPPMPSTRVCRQAAMVWQRSRATHVACKNAGDRELSRCKRLLARQGWRAQCREREGAVALNAVRCVGTQHRLKGWCAGEHSPGERQQPGLASTGRPTRPLHQRVVFCCRAAGAAASRSLLFFVRHCSSTIGQEHAAGAGKRGAA